MIRRLLLLPLLFFTFAAHAQDALSVAPIISFDYGSPLFINRAPGAFNHSASVDSGVSSSFSYGGGVEAAMGQMGPIGLIGRMQGIYSTGIFTGRDTISGHEWKLAAEALFEWKPSTFSLRAGPWFSARLAGTIFHQGSDVTSSSTLSNPVHYGITAGIAWEIQDFPLRPEINTHLDLSELANAGVNAWSVGISVAYKFGVGRVSTRPSSDRVETRPSSDRVETRPSSDRVETRSTPSVPSRVRFLVDRSELNRNVPLERVEMRVKQYTMVDSANTPPRVTQWVVESYHLPQISISCEVDRDAAGKLSLLKDRQELAAFFIPSTNSGGLTFDTTFDLDQADAWQEALRHLNINESNRVIAELQTIYPSVGRTDTTRDTLFLPPVDTSRAVRTIVKKQFRFYFSDRFSEFEEGKETLDLLLGRMRALLDSNVAITILEPPESATGEHLALKKKILDSLGDRASGARRVTNNEPWKGVVVVLEL